LFNMIETQHKQPLYIVAGPTAVGKTALGFELATRLDLEVVSADSMQVYKYMDIGTAKVTHDEMRGIKHHLIDILEPTEPFHVVEFKNRATQAIEDIYSRGKTPIIVGGTGFYVQALLYDIEFEDEGEDSSIRSELQKIADTRGPEELHRILAEIDPETADTLHYNNVKRVIRAIEFAKQTGTKISDHNAEQRKRESKYDFRYIVLNDNRELVYDRIDRRVDIMMDRGLLEEVQNLVNMGCTADMTSMQGIGYKQILRYLDGEYDLDEAIRIIKRDSRHYAKRQLTWFNREKDLIWINRSEYQDADSQAEYILREHRIQGL